MQVTATVDTSAQCQESLFAIDPTITGPDKEARYVLSRTHSRFFELSGWLLVPSFIQLNGIRAICGRRRFKARRKQLRVDVMRNFPERVDSLHSGFILELDLDWADTYLEFEFKDQFGQWHRCGSYTIAPCLRPLQSLLSNAREQQSTYEIWLETHLLKMASKLNTSEYVPGHATSGPKISLCVPVYNPPLKWLKRMIDSVMAQSYSNWELCLADDCSTEVRVRLELEAARKMDPRIKVVFRKENGHICRASNSALELCTGEFTALLDHDDELLPDALACVAEAIRSNPDVDLWFSDEDKISEDGTPSGPYFKPGWSVDLLYQQNCVSHLGAFRTSLLRKLGGFRPGFEGSQDWDLALRVVEVVGAHRVRHIPAMLYHWRTIPSSTASTMNAKPYTLRAAQKAVQEHLDRMHPGAKIVELGSSAYWKIEWPLPNPQPRVSIIIPTRNQAELLRVTLESLIKNTEYEHYEIIVVDHDSDESTAKDYLKQLPIQNPFVSVLQAAGPFNWAAMSNLGGQYAQGEVLLFLNNDMEIVESGWLRELVSQASRPEVGAVGAALMYPNGRIQHAGVVLGLRGLAGHIYRNSLIEVPTIGGAPHHMREVTAVTGACLAVRKELFQRIEGFDSEHFPVNYGDVDFCLRLRALGYKTIYTPFARLFHHESASRGETEKLSERKAQANEEAATLSKRWRIHLHEDHFFNPNLCRHSELPCLQIPDEIDFWASIQRTAVDTFTRPGSVPI